MKNEFFTKKLSEYEVNKIRAEPEKYLWDALDRYFGVLDVTPGAVYKMPELLTMRIWSADDVEIAAEACSLIGLEKGDDYATKISEIKDDGSLDSKNRLARKKIGFILRAMKRSKIGKINLELKNVKNVQGEGTTQVGL